MSPANRSYDAIKPSRCVVYLFLILNKMKVDASVEYAFSPHVCIPA